MKKLLSVITLVLIIGMVLSACGKGNSTTTTAAPVTTSKPVVTTSASTTTTPVPPIKIGILEDISGAVGVYGLGFAAGEKFAIQQINDAGGIKSLGGAKLTWVQGQADSTPVTGTAEATRLITSENVLVMLGPTLNQVSLAVVPIMEQYKVPDIGLLTDPAFYTLGNKYQFSLSAPTDIRGTLEANFIDWLAKNQGAPMDRIAVATLQVGYTAQTDTMIAALAKLGHKNVVLNESFPGTITDQSSLVLKLKAANPTFVVYNGSPTDAILFFKACATYDYYPWMVTSSSSLQPNVRDALGADAAKVMARPNLFAIGNGLFTDAYTTVPSLKNFQDAFMKANPGSTLTPTFVAQGALKVYVLAKALEAAGSRKPEDIAAALRKIDIKAPDPALVLADQYPRLTMSDSGLVTTGSNMAVQWNDAVTAYQTIWPPEMAGAAPRVKK